MVHFESINLVLIYLGYLSRVVGGCYVSTLSLSYLALASLEYAVIIS